MSITTSNCAALFILAPLSLATNTTYHSLRMKPESIRKRQDFLVSSPYDEQQSTSEFPSINGPFYDERRSPRVSVCGVRSVRLDENPCAALLISSSEKLLIYELETYPVPNACYVICGQAIVNKTTCFGGISPKSLKKNISAIHQTSSLAFIVKKPGPEDLALV